MPRKRSISVNDSEFDVDDGGPDPQELLPVPPDGGYGWVIVFASLCCMMIVDGIVFTSSEILPALEQAFSIDSVLSATVSSVLPAVYLTVGPLVSALVNRFGYRPVTLCGSLIAGTAFVLSTFTSSIQAMIGLYSVLGGIGFGMMYLPPILAVGFYFEKRRAIATGIAVCGSGVGMFTMAPLRRFLLEEFSWRGAILIEAGIVLNEPSQMIYRDRSKDFVDRLKEQTMGRADSSEDVQLTSTEERDHIMEGVRNAKLARIQLLRSEDSESDVTSGTGTSRPSFRSSFGTAPRSFKDRDAAYVQITEEDGEGLVDASADTAKVPSLSVADAEGGATTDSGPPSTERYRECGHALFDMQLANRQFSALDNSAAADPDIARNLDLEAVPPNNENDASLQQVPARGKADRSDPFAASNGRPIFTDGNRRRFTVSTESDKAPSDMLLKDALAGNFDAFEHLSSVSDETADHQVVTSKGNGVYRNGASLPLTDQSGDGEAHGGGDGDAAVRPRLPKSPTPYPLTQPSDVSLSNYRKHIAEKEGARLLTSSSSASPPRSEMGGASGARVRRRRRREREGGGGTSYTRSHGAIHDMDYHRPMYRRDIFYSGSVQRLPEYHMVASWDVGHEAEDMRSYVASITAIPITDERAWFPPDSKFHALNKLNLWSKLPKPMRDALSEMINPALFTHSGFLCICIANAMFLSGVFIPIVFLTAHAKEVGLTPQQTGYLIPVFGILNTVGRILAGFLADLPNVSALFLNNLAMVVLTAITVLLPFLNSFFLLVSFSVVFGLCFAFLISLTTVVLCDTVGLQRLTNAFGLLTLVRGISSSIGAPIGGALLDATKDYHAMFYFAGTMFGIATLCFMLLTIDRVRYSGEKPKDVPDGVLLADITSNESPPADTAAK